MARVQKPLTNQVYFEVVRPFTWEGFHELDVVGAFQEIGYSKAEIGRLFKDGAIKIWDTRLNGNKFEWYKRKAETQELVEPDDVFIFGHPKVLIIKQMPFTLWEKIYYWLRGYFEGFRA